MTRLPVIIRHNFKPNDFMWLWAKYVVGFNEQYHCTNCLRGRYSRRFSKARNPLLEKEHDIAFDEYADHRAIYICGVARRGYSSKTNYRHNVHLAIEPSAVPNSVFRFEHWIVHVKNGTILPIPGVEELTPRLQSFSEAYTSCRIFRWGSKHFSEMLVRSES